MCSLSYEKNADKVMNNVGSKAVSFKSALWMVIVLSSVVIIVHLLILLQILPYEMVWAGKLKSVDEMYVYESISIVVNGLLILTILIKGQAIKANISPKAINAILWAFVILFSLNTLGNLTSKTSIETVIATPLTFIFACLCLRIVTDTTMSK